MHTNRALFHRTLIRGVVLFATVSTTVSTAVTESSATPSPQPHRALLAWQDSVAGAKFHNDGTIIRHGKTLHFVQPRMRLRPDRPGHAITHNPNEEKSVGTSTNWTGYTDKPPAGNYFGQVDMEWVVPSVSSTSREHYSSIWPGIGGGTSRNDVLIQAGTDQDSSSSGRHYAWWWEFYPNFASVELSFAVSPGDNVEARITYSPSGSAFTANFELYDYAKSAYTHFSELGDTKSGGQAEAIVERPTVDGRLPFLSLFGTAYITVAQFRAIGQYRCIDGWGDPERDDMYTTDNRRLAYSRYTTSDGCAFTTTRTSNDL